MKTIDPSNQVLAHHRSGADILLEIIEHAPFLVDSSPQASVPKTERDRQREDISRRSQSERSMDCEREILRFMRNPELSC